VGGEIISPAVVVVPGEEVRGGGAGGARIDAHRGVAAFAEGAGLGFIEEVLRREPAVAAEAVAVVGVVGHLVIDGGGGGGRAHGGLR